MSKFSVKKPLTVFVAVLAVIILGVVAFTRMTPDLLPNMDFPYVMIMTTYPGQSPEIVEQEITRPLEQSMATLEHIKELSSTSQENYSLVVLEFEESVNMDTVGVDIQQNIAALQGTWDEAVGTPYVLKINPSVIPIAIASVSKSDMDIAELSDFLDETIVPKLEGVAGVASVSVSGSIYRQVHVVISQDKIDAVNRRLAAKVNGQLDDAQQELEDTKAELDSAKAELDSAKEQLDSGKEQLINQSGAAQSELSQQQAQIQDGKLQIQTQLTGLQSTRTTISSGLTSLQQAQSGLQQIDEGIAQLQSSIDQIKTMGDEAGLLAQKTQAEAALPAMEAAVAAAQGAVTAAETDVAAAQAEVDRLQALVDALPPEDPDVGGLRGQLTAAQSYLAAQSAVLEGARTGFENANGALAAAKDGIAQLDQAIGAVQSLPGLEAQLAALRDNRAKIVEALAAQGIQEADLPDRIAELQGQLAQVDDGIAQLNTALDQLNSGSIQLSEAMGVLSQSQASGLLELANAQTQLNINSASLDSGLAQVDSGLEQLADYRADALEQADISGSITMESVAQILGAQDFSMPAGFIEEDGISYMVSVGDEIKDENELRLLLLFDTGEDGIGPVYLEDVADVFITDNADSVYAKLNGADSVMLTFDKQSNAATAEVSDNLKARFDELEKEYPGLKFVPLMDQGDYIYLITDSIISSLLTGALFAIIVLFLFLRDIRPTVITLVSIPVSVIFAFVLMYFSGVTLNMISLSGLAVAVGMLVDNSIVVIENIYRLRSKGATAAQAAVAGARQVAGAVTASTLTTVCVFLPIVFVEGITRQLFTDLALTMTYSLMASLIIALTLVPAMAKGMLKKEKKKRPHGKREKQKHSAVPAESVFYRGYRRLAGWNLRHKWVALGLSVLLLAGTAYLALGKGFSFMPEIDMNTVNVTVAMPEGTERDEAVKIADQALERIAQLPNAEYVGAMMGSGSLAGTGGSGGGGVSLGTGAGGSSGEYDVTVYVGLPEGDSGAAAGAAIAELCADLPCEIQYDSAMMDMSLLTGSGITVNLYGEDMADLQKGAEAMGQALTGVDGVDQVDNGLEEAATAYHVSVDRNKAMKKGFTVAQIYMEIATALTNSTTAMDMDLEGASADVTVESEDGLTLRELEELKFTSTDQKDGSTSTFQLRDVASVDPTVSLATISRIDQRRYISVTASLLPGRNVTLATADAEKAAADARLPEGVTYEFAGENETIMEAVEDLFLMLVIGVVLVYFIMVAQFQSLKSPFIVMFTIPLAFTGGFAALLICGMDVSIVSIIGFVMLVGIIVNNGIVLVDYVNQLRAAGMARREALVEAGVTRMRPIFMTSLTTILGLIVMATGRNVGTALMQPVAVVCIGGLLYATIMTLFVVPCIYDLLNRKELEVIRDEELEFAEDGDGLL